MIRIVGGLLVLSMLSGIERHDVNLIAYELYKSKTAIFDNLERDYDVVDKAYTEKDIESIMSDMDHNKRYISELIDKKKNSLARIENILKEKADNKIYLTKGQIDKFNEFSKLCEEERGNVQDSLELITNIELNDIQKHMLHKDIDYDYIYRELYNIVKGQNDIIEYLNKIIREADNTIEILC
ncbi:MAG: hypothetical protein E7234_12405 [Lachnospiraceae bacterium]|jgi:Holliday junction resolvase|nr:hypothetical protein [Lachnospiraceae bacterium]